MSALNISALQLTSILTIVRSVFLISEKIIHSRPAFGKDRNAFHKCHHHRWGWGSLSWSGQVWRKVRGNDVWEWPGGLLAVLIRPHHSAPGTSAEAILLPFPFRALTLSEEALCLLTSGDLRIFWKPLEPGIIFSEICLASFRDLSFRPRHNYSCFGSILATVTVLFLGCH